MDGEKDRQATGDVGQGIEDALQDLRIVQIGRAVQGQGGVVAGRQAQEFCEPLIIRTAGTLAKPEQKEVTEALRKFLQALRD